MGDFWDFEGIGIIRGMSATIDVGVFISWRSFGLGASGTRDVTSLRAAVQHRPAMMRRIFDFGA